MSRRKKTPRSKKNRRHSGRVIVKIYKPTEFPYEWVYWDDWIDRRDGMRDIFNDRTLLCKNTTAEYYWGHGKDGVEYKTNKERNARIKKQVKIRQLKKTKRQNNGRTNK